MNAASTAANPPRRDGKPGEDSNLPSTVASSLGNSPKSELVDQDSPSNAFGVVSPASKSGGKSPDLATDSSKVPIVISPAGTSSQSNSSPMAATKPDSIHDVSTPPKPPVDNQFKTTESKSELLTKTSAESVSPEIIRRYSSASSVLSLSPSSLDELIANFCKDSPKKKRFEMQSQRENVSEGHTVKDIFNARSSTSSLQNPGSSPDLTSITEDDSCLDLDTSRVPVLDSMIPEIVTTSSSMDIGGNANTVKEGNTCLADTMASGGAQEDGEQDLKRITRQIFLSDEENSFKAARLVVMQRECV